MAVYPLSPREDFINWCRDHVKVFNANAASIGLTPTQATGFSEAYDAAQAAVVAQAEAKQAAEAATETANAQVALLKKTASNTVKLIKTFAATTGNDSVYATAQIPAPDAPSPIPAPGQPTDITVGIQPGSGAITLKWKCENPPGASGTAYVIRRKIAGQSAFEFVGVTGKKSFTDTTFVAGPDSVNYTIQAQRSDKSGLVSQLLTINFGTPGSPVPSRISLGESLKMAA